MCGKKSTKKYMYNYLFHNSFLNFFSNEKLLPIATDCDKNLNLKSVPAKSVLFYTTPTQSPTVER